ncbi:MAG TPA: SRPBCC family protein [Mycobacterium sp.]|uniref:SRPBCC family protein n=1 Tax=Mycolicibacterium sp. TaxID=2320850 RepID=UPI002600E8E9|nr:SRPBCC family protein [Mycolicibacterium sp.]HPX36137.1 SRPBCC family protein [Mycobacterium sp.]HQC75690.1 SRPBCC family protein [Mycobacterium sp.]
MGIALRPGVDRLIAAPVPVVWRLLSDVRQWPAWGPSVRRAVLTDGATVLSAGAQGTVWTVGGVGLPFRITEFDEEDRWSWTVAGLTATGHRIMPAGGGCRVRFEVPWWATAYLPVCTIGLDRLARLAQGLQ